MVVGMRDVVRYDNSHVWLYARCFICMVSYVWLYARLHSNVCDTRLTYKKDMTHNSYT